jgi:hypothetical protein
MTSVTKLLGRLGEFNTSVAAVAKNIVKEKAKKKLLAQGALEERCPNSQVHHQTHDSAMFSLVEVITRSLSMTAMTP